MPSTTSVRTRRLAMFALAGAAIAGSFLADVWAFRSISNPTVYDRDWGRLLRVMGSLVLWLPAGLALWLHDRPSRSPRGAWLFAGATLGGAAAELLKLLVRRLRPTEAVAGYVFRAWSDHPFSTGGLGMPSSHTMVAFAAAGVLARLFPRARVVWYALAAGCGMTRVLARAHWLSDVVVGAVSGLAVAALLWRSSWVRRGLATTDA